MSVEPFYAICQEPSFQPLHSPALFKGKDIGAGYDNVGDLNDGDGISQPPAKKNLPHGTHRAKQRTRQR